MRDAETTSSQAAGTLELDDQCRPTCGASRVVGEPTSSTEEWTLAQLSLSPNSEIADSPTTPPPVQIKIEYEAQIILDPPATPVTRTQSHLVKADQSQKLGLPQVLYARPHWTTAHTRQLIAEICGGPENVSCSQCGMTLSSHRRLWVHVPQHFTITYCPCGEYSYQRDYVLKHQRIDRCHTGRIFEVDSQTFPEFRDLILPHVREARKRSLLQRGFPSCRPALEDKNIQHPGVDIPHTQPLRVVISKVEDISAHKKPLLPVAETSAAPATRRRRREARSHGPLLNAGTGVLQQIQAVEEQLIDLTRELQQCMVEVTRLRRYLSPLEQGAQPQL